MTRLRIALALGACASMGACAQQGPCDPDAPGTICTIAGASDGLSGFGGDDGPALEAHLSVPQDVAIGPDGRPYILDFNNYCIRAIEADGTITRFLGIGAVLGDSSGIPARDAAFNHTTDLFFDGSDYLYLAAWHNSKVKRVDLKTGLLEDIAGVGKRTLFSGDGGPALAASLDLPSSVAKGPDGNLYFMDQANESIRYVDRDGIVNHYAGLCVVESPSQCGGDRERLPCPDPEPACGDGRPTDTTLVTTACSIASPDPISTSEKLTCPAMRSECATTQCAGGRSPDGGLAGTLRMNQPGTQAALPAGHIAFDQDGNLLFADSGNGMVRKIDRATRVVTTIAGTGTSGYSGDGGPATSAELDYPVDLEVGPDGSVYIADQDNNCVRRVDPDGIITAVVGRCGRDQRGFSGDGEDPLEAQLDRPAGIELAGDKLYVADSHNNRIRVVNLP